MKKCLSSGCVLLLLTMICIGCGTNMETLPLSNEALTWQQHYDLGVRFLAEGAYEEAIVSLTYAIEIDPKQVEVYLYLAEAYEVLGDRESVEAVLKQGMSHVEDTSLLQEYMDSLLISSDTMDAVMDVNMDAVVYLPKEDEQWIKMTNTYSNGQISSELWYDSEGNVVRETIYNRDGTIWYHVLYEYDTNGSVIREQTYSGDWVISSDVQYSVMREYHILFGEDGVATDYNYYEHDDLGRVIRRLEYDADKKFDEDTRFEYDAMGNQIRESSYDEEGQLTSYFVNEYDDEGKQTRYDLYWENGVLDHYSLFEYDENGNFTGQKFYEEQGNLIDGW